MTTIKLVMPYIVGVTLFVLVMCIGFIVDSILKTFISKIFLK